MDCLLLHGWGVTNKVWQDFANQLSGYDSVFVPCLYQAANKTKDNSFFSIANILSESINKDCIVIAWSIGGLIATYLSTISNKIKTIIYIASAPCFINKDQWSNVIAEKELDALHSKLLDDPEVALGTFSGLVAHGDKPIKDTVKYLRHGTASEGDVRVLSSWLHELKQADLRKDLALLTIPNCFLLGQYDALINCEIAEQLIALNTNTSCAVIKNCGHAPFISKAKESQKLITEFLNAEFRR